MHSNTVRTASGAVAGLAVALSLPAPAVAQTRAPILLTGHARTGDDVRDARFEFGCSDNNGPNETGALAVRLIVPHADSLATKFSFDPFEGPDASAGELSTLTAASSGKTTESRFAVAGSYGVDPDQPFVFELDAARRGDAKRLAALARTLRTLTLGAATLVWRQDNATPHGVAIVASLAISPGDAARLGAALGPCLAGK